VIRFATAAVVCAVAAFAAVVSYSHIYGLGRTHGQDGTAARLLPLSVDGLILAASLVLLHEARNGRDAPRLVRFMLWLGIGATIGANIPFRAGYGVLGAVISAWPAVALIGSVEIAMQQVRRVRAPRAGTIESAVPEVPGDVEQAVRAAYAASVAAGDAYQARTGRRELYIALVGTRAAGRKRGIATALLITAMSAARAAGYDQASLGVDADSLTDAVRLYENVGFTVALTWTVYRKRLA
jgi:ribosomal protein S18 acetylase RimI-like enzyme